MSEHPRTRKIAGIGLVMIIVTIAIVIPPLVANLLGAGALAGSLILPVMAALMPAAMLSWRTALGATAVLVISTILADLANGLGLIEAVIMAVTSFAIGIGCRWGASKFLILVPISVGFIVCLPPQTSESLTINALTLGGATLLAALWGLAVGLLIHPKIPRPKRKEETWERTWAYASTLAVLTGIAAYISVDINWGHEGAWFILTVVVVFQPYLNDAVRRSWQRAAGTLLGVGVAFAIQALVPWTWLMLGIAEVLMITAMFLMINPKYPYWLYTTVFTPAILLVITAGGEDFVQTAIARLVATLSGGALALAAVALLTPLFRAKAKEVGTERH